MREALLTRMDPVAAPCVTHPAIKRPVVRNKIQGFTSLLAFDNWPALAFCRLFDRRTGCTVYRRNGLEILVDHLGGDENGTRQCIVSDMYRAFLPSLRIKQPARVLDLGANGGGFPLMLKLEGIPLRRVISVEMNPVTYSRLLFNLATNLGSLATPVNAAVSGESSNAEITLESSRGSTGQRLIDRGSHTNGVTVRTTTIRELCETGFEDGQPIDICKIDIEGAEYDALAGTPDCILTRIGHLFIEFHDRKRTPAVLARLQALNFSEVAPPANRQSSGYVQVFANNNY